MVTRWSNWAGTAACLPSAIARPASTDEVAALVRSAVRAKVAGTGHSFTPIACTDGLLLHLGAMNRVLAVDRVAKTATVGAGMTIHALAEALAHEGLALANLGDIGVQAIAGAIATGTHGTGETLGSISTLVEAMEIVLADGSVVHCSPEEQPDVWRAARVGLGALGVVTAVTLRCVDAFTLHAIEEPMRLDECLGRIDELVGTNDHFELFWFPHTDRAMTKRNNRVDGPPEPPSKARAWLDDVLLSNHAFGLVCRIGRARPAAIPRLANMVAGGLSRREYSDRSDRVFTSPRLVRFVEMEYALPREAVREAVLGVRRIIEQGGHRISFPIEVRFGAGDDIALSPAFGRDTCYVAVHVYAGMPYDAYFRECEALFAGLGGRPHWGKMHGRDAASLRDAYPEWDSFAGVRTRLDPGGKLRNEYLDRVLGPP